MITANPKHTPNVLHVHKNELVYIPIRLIQWIWINHQLGVWNDPLPNVWPFHLQQTEIN